MLIKNFQLTIEHRRKMLLKRQHEPDEKFGVTRSTDVFNKHNNSNKMGGGFGGKGGNNNQTDPKEKPKAGQVIISKIKIGIESTR